jgi:lipocalin
MPAAGITATIRQRAGKAAADEDQRKRHYKNQFFAHFYLLNFQIVNLLNSTTILERVTKTP